MRILSMEEMSLVVGGGRLDSPNHDGSRGGWGKSDNNSTHGPSSRGRGTAEHDRNRSQESYLGRDVNGTNITGVAPDVARNAIGGAIAGSAGGLVGGVLGALGGAYSGSGNGWTTTGRDNSRSEGRHAGDHGNPNN